MGALLSAACARKVAPTTPSSSTLDTESVARTRSWTSPAELLVTAILSEHWPPAATAVLQPLLASDISALLSSMALPRLAALSPLLMTKTLPCPW